MRVGSVLVVMVLLLLPSGAVAEDVPALPALPAGGEPTDKDPGRIATAPTTSDCLTTAHSDRGSEFPDIFPILENGEYGGYASVSLVVTGATVLLVVRPTECIPGVPDQPDTPSDPDGSETPTLPHLPALPGLP